jgi:hypothetical protein
MKNRKNYVVPSTATLTQSGLLAVLLQRQREKAIELTRRGTCHEQVARVIRKFGFSSARSRKATAALRTPFDQKMTAPHTRKV